MRAFIVLAMCLMVFSGCKTIALFLHKEPRIWTNEKGQKCITVLFKKEMQETDVCLGKHIRGCCQKFKVYKIVYVPFTMAKDNRCMLYSYTQSSFKYQGRQEVVLGSQKAEVACNEKIIRPIILFKK